jgi:hypothetical protein
MVGKEGGMTHSMSAPTAGQSEKEVLIFISRMEAVYAADP